MLSRRHLFSNEGAGALLKDRLAVERRGIVSLFLQAIILVAAYWLALAVRYDFHFTSATGVNWLRAYFLPLVGVVVCIKLAVWVAMGLHRGTWRYVGLGDLAALFVASQVALAAQMGFFYAVQAIHFKMYGRYLWVGLPESVFILDAVFGLLLVGGARLLVRLVHEESRPAAPGGMTRLLIIGAGDAAETVLRELHRMPEQRYRVVGLLDDAPAKQGLRIHGAPVLGAIAKLPQIAAQHQVAEILIAIPSASKEQMQQIVAMCRAAQVASNQRGGESAGIRFRTIPSMADLITGRTMAHQIRDVSLNDLLGRDAVEMDLAAVGALVHQHVVLVSGAGGSIGSEMCRTIARFNPATLLLVDKAENAIFEIDRELKKTFPAVRIVPAIGDITDVVRLEQIFGAWQPVAVFHAAAHKHVPLAELNPGEAIRNNVFGTKTLADVAARSGVKNFVMISTDKAVNPSSIMGATKRCAEIYIQSLARRSNTNFITVRFGNVLGSNGSVVPIFKQQIAAGGPVTVTHPEMRRYFMTIPEASQLVLQAGALGQRGEIFVLDMGQPVRILDLARDLITLSGLRPEVDIPIVFTGLRPGEKLYEELSIHGENMVPTRHPKIAVWRSQQATPQMVQAMIDDLEPLQHCNERPVVLRFLQKYIPEMRPWQAEENASPAPAQEQH